MSMARLVITAVTVEGRSKSEVARDYGVSRVWVQKLVRRYQREGPAAFEPRSRRPHSNPRAVDLEVEDQIVRLRKTLTKKGVDAGAETIAAHLQMAGVSPVPAVSTIWRILARRGFVVGQPQKRPRSSWRTFCAEQPNERWQADITHWRLADGSEVEILNILDDHSRVNLAAHARRITTGRQVVDTFLTAFGRWGMPASVLTDNGAIFTGKQRREGRVALEIQLGLAGIRLGHSRPYHPQTCGMVERFHQTQKKWLAAQPGAATVAGLQRLLDRFGRYYNTIRPHRALDRRTPARQRRPTQGRPDRAGHSRSLPGADRITPDTKVAVLAEQWFSAVSSGSLSPSTLEVYGDMLRRLIIPSLGNLRVRELTVGSVDRHLNAVKVKHGPAVAKTDRTVLSGLCKLACRHDALGSNPCRETSRLSTKPKEPPTSLSVDEMRLLRTSLAADQQAIEADIVDLVTLLMASGLRLGEALSLRWTDVDFESGTLEVKGTVLRVRGEGLIITSSPKSAAGQRILELPTWATDMLRRRYASRVGDQVFPAPRSGTVRDRSNTGRSLRSAFARAGFAGLSSHAFRKSVATLMSEAGLSSRDAADQLGHSRPSMTTDVYFGRKKRARGAAAVLENLFDG